MINYMSPIVIDGPYVSDSHLWVNKVGPSIDMRCDVEIQRGPVGMEHRDGSYMLAMELTVSVSLYDDAPDESQRERRMEAQMSVHGTVSITDMVEASVDEIKNNLKLNAISMFYSFIKAQIESQTSMSPMKRFTIPAINPQKLCEAVEED